MHKEVLAFIQKVKTLHPKYFKDSKVVEMGSMDINGTPREFFTNCEYIGIDWRGGKGVDKIQKAHCFSEKVDVVITTEMLEHDKHYDETLINIQQILKSGGLLILTCAGPGRKEHEVSCGEDDHYLNISADEISFCFDMERWKEFYIKRQGGDLQLWAIKK